MTKITEEHINLFIVERAKDRLIETTDSISRIAYDLGFEYPTYFARLFKKHTGKTPSEFRK